MTHQANKYSFSRMNSKRKLIVNETDDQDGHGEIVKRPELQRSAQGSDVSIEGNRENPLNSHIPLNTAVPKQRMSSLTKLKSIDDFPFVYREPQPYISGTGKEFEYQKNPEWKNIMKEQIEYHYNAWKRKGTGKISHPLFLSLGGQGTGKSRLLDEFHNLLKESLSDTNNEELKSMIENAWSFKLSFSSATFGFQDLFDPSDAIGVRMLHQLLPDDSPWHVTSQYKIAHVQAIDKMKRSMNINPETPACVIIAFDSLHGLPHHYGRKDSHLYRTISSLCNIINASKDFYICIGASSNYIKLHNVLYGFGQRRVFLTPPPLDASRIINVNSFQDVISPEILKLSMDDLGGHARAVEVLYEILLAEKRTGDSNHDFPKFMSKVFQRLDQVYPNANLGLPCFLLEKCISVAMARKPLDSHVKEDLELIDQSFKYGLFRFNDYSRLLEVPCIVWLMYERAAMLCDHLRSFKKREEFETPIWDTWESFNRKFRIMKSIAFENEGPTEWRNLHRGAKFGENCYFGVVETRREYKEKTSITVTDSENCKHGYDVSKYFVKPSSGSESGDAFLCLQLEDKSFIHKVHLEKNTKEKVSLDMYIEERKKGASENDAFIMFTTSEVSEDVLEKIRCAYVDSACWRSYYRTFASGAFFLKTELPPKVNSHFFELLQAVKGVGKKESLIIEEERAKQ